MKISVLSTTNRNDELIIRALDSLNYHDTDNIEFLINLEKFDDEIIKKIQIKGYPNLKIFQFEGGMCQTYNGLIRESSGEYIARVDDDDLYLPNRLGIQSNYLDLKQEVDIVGASMYLKSGDQIRFDGFYYPTHEQILLAALFNNNIFAHPVTMARRSFFDKLLYEDSPSVEDYDLWIRGICQGKKYANIEIPLFVYTEPNYSIEKNLKQFDSINISKAKLLKYLTNHDEKTINEILYILDITKAIDKNSDKQRQSFVILIKSLVDFGFGLGMIENIFNKFKPNLLDLKSSTENN